MKKRTAVVVAVVLGAASLVAGGYYTWLITPPDLPQTADEALNTISTARYKRLPDYRKQAYLSHAQKLVHDLPEAERTELFRRARTDDKVRESVMAFRRSDMIRRAREFAKAPPEEKIQLLDDAIDRRERRRAARARRQGSSDRGRQRRGPHGGRFREHIKERFEEGNPQQMGLIAEYFKALRARREQRGLSRRH